MSDEIRNRLFKMLGEDPKAKQLIFNILSEEDARVLEEQITEDLISLEKVVDIYKPYVVEVVLPMANKLPGDPGTVGVASEWWDYAAGNLDSVQMEAMKKEMTGVKDLLVSIKNIDKSLKVFAAIRKHYLVGNKLDKDTINNTLQQLQLRKYVEACHKIARFYRKTREAKQIEEAKKVVKAAELVIKNADELQPIINGLEKLQTPKGASRLLKKLKDFVELLVILKNMVLKMLPTRKNDSDIKKGAKKVGNPVTHHDLTKSQGPKARSPSGTNKRP